MPKKSTNEISAYVKYRADVLGILQPGVAAEMGMSVSTLKKRMDEPTSLTFTEFRRLMEILKADNYNRERLLAELGGQT